MKSHNDRISNFGQALRMGWLAHALLAAGRVKDVRRVALEALDLARRYCERGHWARVHGGLDQIIAEDEPEDDAAANGAYSEQIAIASELRMRSLVAHCHLGLGKLYRRTDKREQAQEHLTTAIAMYRGMGMTYWLERAEAEMTNLGIELAASRRPAI
jgi:hypothetical protein